MFWYLISVVVKLVCIVKLNYTKTKHSLILLILLANVVLSTNYRAWVLFTDKRQKNHFVRKIDWTGYWGSPALTVSKQFPYFKTTNLGFCMIELHWLVSLFHVFSHMWQYIIHVECSFPVIFSFQATSEGTCPLSFRGAVLHFVKTLLFNTYSYNLKLLLKHIKMIF